MGLWKIVPIVKGYDVFSFSSLKDLRRVLGVGSWSLKPGVLHIFAWVPDFQPMAVKQTTAQC